MQLVGSGDIILNEQERRRDSSAGRFQDKLAMLLPRNRCEQAAKVANWRWKRTPSIGEHQLARGAEMWNSASTFILMSSPSCPDRALRLSLTQSMSMLTLSSLS